MKAIYKELVSGDKCFDAAHALHWYCVQWHGGQWSKLYSIMCRLRFVPSPMNNGYFDNPGDETAGEIYAMLTTGKIDAVPLFDAVMAALRLRDMKES